MSTRTMRMDWVEWVVGGAGWSVLDAAAKWVWVRLRESRKRRPNSHRVDASGIRVHAHLSEARGLSGSPAIGFFRPRSAACLGLKWAGESIGRAGGRGSGHGATGDESLYSVHLRRPWPRR